MNYQKQVIIIIALSVLIGAIFNTLRHDGIKWLAEPIKTVTDPEDALNILAEPSIREIDIETARKVLGSAEGIKVLDNPGKNIYPMPLVSTGQDEVFVGRLREDISKQNSIALFTMIINWTM